ncbi:MAG TPA: glycosyltransferase family 39 protein [Bryobacteraceae bacterium]|jgi:hypothetical protein
MRNQGWRIAWAVAIGIVLSSIAIDIRRPMWADEIYTVLTARQPSVSGILEYIREYCEGIPPLYLAIVHFLIPIFGNDALAARLPATLGFGAMVLGVFTFCKARMNAAYSLLAALLCCQVCLYFAREGRPYGAVLGCATWALVFWQRAPARRRADLIGLAVCLGFAVALHYYAICILGSLLLAEMIAACRDRKWNPGVLWAMTAPLMVLAIHYPLIHAGRPFQVHFWSKAEFGMILPFYGRFLWPILLLCGGAFAVFRVFTLNGRARENLRNLPQRDVVMLLALCATPALTVMVSMVTTHIFVDRYLLWAAPGFAIVAAATLEKSVAPNNVVPKSLIAILLTMLCFQQVVGIAREPKLTEGAEALNKLKGLGRIEGIIVIPDAHVFAELAYYAPSYIRNCLVYPEDADLDIQYFGSDSSPLQYRALGKRGELAVQSLDQLLERYPNFTMVAYNRDYLPNYLRRRGWKLKSLTESDQPVIWYAKRDRMPWRALSTSR